MEYKNTKLDLFGSVWTINFVNHLIEDSSESDALYSGWADHIKRTISVSTHDNDGNPFTDYNIMVTLFHEVFHAAFGEGQYCRECDNEPMVEWLAKCVTATIKQLNI